MELNSSHEIGLILAEARARDGHDDAVIATDIAGTIVYWNDRAESLYGWRPDEVVGRNIVDVTPTRGSQDEAAEIMEWMRLGETWSGSFIVQRRDGTPILAHVIDIPVCDVDHVIGIVGLSRRERA